MMTRAAIAAVLLACVTAGCSGKLADTGDGGSSSGGGAGGSGGGASSGGTSGEGGGPTGPRATSNKVDLLFMIDNSASMGDKQNLLAQAVPDLVNRLLAPNCLDASGNPDGTTANDVGQCSNPGSTPEFPPVHDLHIGVVTSSLGGRGGDVCPADATNPANPSLNSHNDDRGELIDRGGVQANPTIENVPSTDLDAENFLGWFPNVPNNQNMTPPPPPVVTAQAALVSDFQTLVWGVHEHGCGFEAQNEAWYRFLIQPDPFDQIVKNGNTASFQGIDDTILQQRADFLRPDSLVAIVVLTDENEEAADPLSVGAQGWAFDNEDFPGSPNGAAPQGTVECQNFDPANPSTTGPNDPNCTSCAFIQGDPNFATRCPKDGNNGANGYLDPADDTLNTRFYHQKFRFGLFAGYPTARYVRGLQQGTVPDSQHEHDASGNYIGAQDSSANCVNPLYAENLPTTGSGPGDPTLCQLAKGARNPDLVFYAAIAGVPHQLLQATPGGSDGVCPAGTDPSDCPQKTTLTDADWTLIMGTDPENYDFRGADFHMVEDWNPRTGAYASSPGATTKSPWQKQGTLANLSSCPPSAAGVPQGTACDPINGGEWAPRQGDLQFACIFDLRPQYGGVGKDCTNPEYSGACDCAQNALNAGTQLCDASTPTLQIYGKAYPSVREMIIAKAMAQSPAGNQGVVSSLCPIHVTDSAAGDDPLYGYRPGASAIVTRIGASLAP